MINLLILLLLLFPSSDTHRVTFYWPGQDAWGTAVADQTLMRHGPLPVESWGWPLCAVSPDLLDVYPYGTWLYIDIEGDNFWDNFRRVSDCTASWVQDTVDIRMDKRRMECYRARVWVVIWTRR